MTLNQKWFIIKTVKGQVTWRIKGEKDMVEEMAVFKGYLRSLMRQLQALKEAMQSKDYEKAEKLIDQLIEDTQKNIED